MRIVETHDHLSQVSFFIKKYFFLYFETNVPSFSSLHYPKFYTPVLANYIILSISPEK